MMKIKTPSAFGKGALIEHENGCSFRTGRAKRICPHLYICPNCGKEVSTLMQGNRFLTPAELKQRGHIR